MRIRSRRAHGAFAIVLASAILHAAGPDAFASGHWSTAGAVPSAMAGSCDADAGTLAAIASSVCMDNGTATVSAVTNDDATVPDGFEAAYLLTEGPGLLIVQVGAAPSFTVAAIGDYRVHTLVHDPLTLDLATTIQPGTTTASDVDALLVQGGGVICGSLDMTGAEVSVIDCPCDADAGTLAADASPVCLDNGTAMVSATPNNDATVPTGFETAYLLTEGPGLLIVQTGAAPSFTVTAIGDYHVHTLVHDPLTLDLATIQLGVTTANDVDALLEQGGGSICGSLDMTGAAVSVIDCPCTADAGTLTAGASPVCLDNGTATVSATPNGDATVPTGFETAYLLTEGPGLLIVQTGAAPSFTVTAIGDYHVHTLVHDPLTLDLATIQLGVTAINDVDALLEQGGGSICGSLDLTGVAVSVIDCPCTADGGTLTAVASPVCIDNGTATVSATPNGDATVPTGFETAYLLTEGPGLLIVQTGAAPSFTVAAIGDYHVHALVHDPATLDLATIQTGTTAINDVDALLEQGGGSICGSLDMTGATVSVIECPCTADAGTLTAGTSPVCLDNGTATVSATPNNDATVPTGFEAAYLLTEGPGLLIVQTGATPSFTVTAIGDYHVHTLVHDPLTLDLTTIQLGVTTANDVDALLEQGGGAICGSLDMTGAAVSVIDCPCTADAGTLTAGTSPVCLDNGTATVSATPNNDATVPTGFETAYLLTEGPGLLIVQTAAAPSFTVAAIGDYHVHTLVHDPATLDLATIQPGVTTANDVDALLEQGGGSICGSLDMTGAAVSVIDCPCTADAGTLTAGASPVCLDNGTATVSATPNNDATVPTGFETAYLLTEGPGLLIVQTGAAPSFTVAAIGDYHVHTLVHDPLTLDLATTVQTGVTTINDVDALLEQGGGSICGSLDMTGATVSVIECPCTADAGTLTAGTSPVCLDNGTAMVSATPNNDATVPTGFETAYLLTEGPGLLIVQTGAAPSFTVAAIGDYHVHALVHDPATLDLATIQPGVTTANDVDALLEQGGGSICGSLDMTGAAVSVIDCPCTADAGTLTAGASPVCLDNGTATVSATPNNDATIPTGFETAYLLTEGPGLLIVQTGAAPSFTVAAIGDYHVHTLVHDPLTLDLATIQTGTTTINDVDALLEQGGGSICGSLDMTGAEVSVADCPCDADAGTLTADASSVCLDNGTATVAATAGGDAVVPTDFETAYLLTEGPGLLIVQVGATPSFTVAAIGDYRVHTLVHDPATLDLATIQTGTTTINDVDALLEQGGGAICGSLNMTGALVSVADCPCAANAGTLIAGVSPVCLDNGTATVAATPNGDAVVPADFETAYLLTEGPGLLIVQVDATPSFTVTAIGDYRIHTLVHDPATLDLATIQAGVTTINDVDALLEQGGGSICGSLDMTGALVSVADCPCDADAGTLIAGVSPVCLDNGTATVAATPNGDAVVPADFETAYLLTEGPGLLIVQVDATPSFTVTAIGDYRIHTLVHDPATLDLATIQTGTTTINDVDALLEQGGGSICGSLDMTGALVSVADCPCDADAGTLIAGVSPVCLDNGTATVSATPSGDAMVPTGFETAYLLTEGPGLLIVQTGAAPSFTVTAIGDYRVHTLVHDPLTLDLTTIQPGVTTANDVDALLEQGGGAICGSLDLTGAAVSVADCPCAANAGTLTAVASPVCLNNGTATVSATPGGGAVVPSGYGTAYLLTEGPGLLIIQVGATPSFTVTAIGDYRIHALVHDPATLDLATTIQPGTTAANDVEALLEQGGGSICGSLDMTGAVVSVADCPCDAAAGTLTAVAPMVCLVGGIANVSATPNGDAVVPPGYTTVYLLTEGPGLTVVEVSGSPNFNLISTGDYRIHALVHDPATLDLSVVPLTTAFALEALLRQGGGTICGSLDMTGAAISVLVCPSCGTRAGTLTAGTTPACLRNGTASISAMPNGDAAIPAGYQATYLLTEGPGLLITQVAATPAFTVTAIGGYRIHTLVHDPLTLDPATVVQPGVTTIDDVDALLEQGGGTICGSLDMTGASVPVIDCPCTADAGTLTAGASPVCMDNGTATVSATPNGDATVPVGFETAYLLTEGPGLPIVQVGAVPSFTVTVAGSYHVHTLVHDPATLDLATTIQPGTTTINDVEALLEQGGGVICGGLDMTGAVVEVAECPSCTARAGTLTASAPQTCLENGTATVSATPNGDATVPTGFETAYLLTEGPGLLIVQVGATPSFTVAAIGNYRIHALVHDPLTLDLATTIQPGTTTVNDVDALLEQGGGSICGSLGMTGAATAVILCPSCGAHAGTLTPNAPGTCLENGTATVSATPNGDAVVPAGFGTAYLLTEGTGLLIMQVGITPSFVVTALGSYRVHALVHDPLTLDPATIIQPGVTTAFDVEALLEQGGGGICGSLDMTGAEVAVAVCPCLAHAGTLTAAPSQICLVNGSATVAATPNGDAVVPPGFTTIYLRTTGANLLVLDVSTTPAFVVGGTGSYRVHALVHDPNTFDPSSIQNGVTRASDVEAMLLQGGGAICGSIGMAGAAVDVMDCPCTADAGTLTAGASPVCIDNGTATVSATPNGDAVVPPGYQQTYLLSAGAGLVVQVGSMPTFTVNAVGTYRVHTLVHDPLTLDPATIQQGVTTLADVHALLEQGGGSICGSMDMTSAEVEVIDCSCHADAGTLSADAPETCLLDGTATVSATPNGDATVPAGFITTHLLTEEGNPLISQVGTSPAFIVTATGTYRVHTLVHDPLTLDPATIQPGVTTLTRIEALLEQGGGTICGSLDTAGAAMAVIDCPCDADAGTLTATAAELCLSRGTATVTATLNGDATVPAGFITTHLLTEGAGLLITQVGTTPSFTVASPGTYRIHTLVHDPATLDAGLIQPGTTTALDLDALLIQGGGTICGSLDMTGAATLVRDCRPVNDDCGNAIILSIDQTGACQPVAGDNTHAEQDGADPSCDAGTAGFADVWYVFNSGANTTVAVEVDPMGLSDWAIVVHEGCGGNEVLCRVRPTGPIDITTTPNTNYRVRVYTNLRFSTGGPFTICVTGDVPTIVCNGGTVATASGDVSTQVCQDSDPDIITFAATGAASQSYTFILTAANDVIITPLAGNSLDFNGLPVGLYRVWGFSHNGALTGTGPGNPIAMVGSAGACVDPSGNFAEVEVRVCVGIDGIDGAPAWSVFPNPGNGDLTLQGGTASAGITIEVIDAQGRMAHQEHALTGTGGRHHLPLAGRLTPGVYALRVTSGEERTVLRFVVQ